MNHLYTNTAQKNLGKSTQAHILYTGSSGQGWLRNPIKMYPDNTNLMHAAYFPLAQDQMKGKLRETFVVNQLQNAEKSIFYSKTSDFKIDDHIFEIGGKSKTQRQIKDVQDAFILSDDCLVGSILLYLFGFFY